jgi:antitoxin MazE
MKTAIRKMENSHGSIIPKRCLRKSGPKRNDQVDMGVENGKIVIAPIRKKPRAGWAEASKRLAATRDGDLVWLEFGSDAGQTQQKREAAPHEAVEEYHGPRWWDGEHGFWGVDLSTRHPPPH